MKSLSYSMIFTICVSFFVSCSSGEDGDNNTQNRPDPVATPTGDTGGSSSTPPGSFSLTFPNNNEVCQEGAAVADLPDKLLINFKWSSSANATSYEILVVESASGNEVAKLQTSSTDQDVEVNKGKLYQWKVTATNDDGEFSSSEWSFYSEGVGLGNYVPYPAYNIELIFDSNNDLLSVQWDASDEDGDTLTYDIKIFEDNVEIILETDLSTNILSDIPVALGSSYYAEITVNDGISATSTTSQEFKYEL